MKRKIENKDLQGSWDNKNKYILRNFVTTRLEILIQRKKSTEWLITDKSEIPEWD